MEKSKSDNKIKLWWRNQSQTTKPYTDGEIKVRQQNQTLMEKSKTTKSNSDGEVKVRQQNSTLMEKSKTTKSNSDGEIKVRQQIKLWWRNQRQQNQTLMEKSKWDNKSNSDGEIKVRQQNHTLMEKLKWDNKMKLWWRNQSETTKSYTDGEIKVSEHVIKRQSIPENTWTKCLHAKHCLKTLFTAPEIPHRHSCTILFQHTKQCKPRLQNLYFV